jgi:uncharacterized protein DUF4232
VSAATEQNPRLFTITNVGTKPCALDGYPNVILLDRSGTPIPFTYDRGGDQMVTPDPPSVVQIDPGEKAYLMINTTSCETGTRRTAWAIRVTPPGASEALESSFGRHRIMGFCGRRWPSSVHISPIEPSIVGVSAH